MKLLPFEFYSLHTELPPKVVLERLADQIQAKRTLITKENEYDIRKIQKKPYVGEINNNSFRIYKNTFQRNSFRPFIHGKVLPKGTGSRIEINIHPHAIIIGCLFFFCGIPALILLSFFLPFVQVSFAAVVLLLLWIAFPLGLSVLGFQIENRPTRKFLEELFEAKIQ